LPPARTQRCELTARVGRVSRAEEHVLELVHARVREQQGRIVRFADCSGTSQPITARYALVQVKDRLPGPVVDDRKLGECPKRLVAARRADRLLRDDEHVHRLRGDSSRDLAEYGL
jgi:hypothetical protein